MKMEGEDIYNLALSMIINNHILNLAGSSFMIISATKDASVASRPMSCTVVMMPLGLITPDADDALLSILLPLEGIECNESSEGDISFSWFL